jgi:drug/metabolite transporter (DMT)-like permease
MSSASILVRWAQSEGVPSLVIAAYRLTIAAGILTVPVIRQRGWQDYAKLNRETIGLVLLSGILLTLHFATWITSLTSISVMSSVILVSTTPIWIGLASPLVLGERVHNKMWFSLGIAVIGAALVGFAGWQGATSQVIGGNGLALAGAVCAAGYLIIGRRLRNDLFLSAYLWLVYGTAGLCTLAWVLITGQSLFGYNLAATASMIALGVVPQLIGHSAANYAVRHLSATFVSTTTLGEPIGSTILAALVLKEPPGSFLQVIGGALTLAGIVSASLAEHRAGRQ